MASLRSLTVIFPCWCWTANLLRAFPLMSRSVAVFTFGGCSSIVTIVTWTTQGIFLVLSTCRPRAVSLGLG